MSITVLRDWGIAILFILLQVLIFNQIHLFGVAVPLVFIYIIFKFQVSLSTVWVLTLSFLLGLVVDIFSNTPGMNSLACTVLAFMRRPILSLYLPHGYDYANEVPSIRTFGMWLYVRYALTLSFLYCVVIFLIESLSFFDLPYLLLRIIGSTILTFVLILCIDSLSQGNAKRL